MASKRGGMSPENRARATERLRALNADPDFAAKRSAGAAASMKRLHADGQFRWRHYRRLFKLNTDDQRAAASRRMQALNADPAYRAALAERMRATMSRPELRALARERAIERNRRTLERLGVPPGFEPVYRLARKKGLSREEALALAVSEVARAGDPKRVAERRGL